MMASFGLLALAIITSPAQEVTDLDRFALFKNCDPMHLMILESVDNDEGVEKL